MLEKACRCCGLTSQHSILRYDKCCSMIASAQLQCIVRRIGLSRHYRTWHGGVVRRVAFASIASLLWSACCIDQFSALVAAPRALERPGLGCVSWCVLICLRCSCNAALKVYVLHRSQPEGIPRSIRHAHHAGDGFTNKMKFAFLCLPSIIPCRGAPAADVLGVSAISERLCAPARCRPPPPPFRRAWGPTLRRRATATPT